MKDKHIGTEEKLTDEQLDGVVGGLTLSSFNNDIFFYNSDVVQGSSNLKDLASLVNNTPSGNGENDC